MENELVKALYDDCEYCKINEYPIKEIKPASSNYNGKECCEDCRKLIKYALLSESYNILPKKSVTNSTPNNIQSDLYRKLFKV